jgi:hypothetical protein
MRGVLEETFFQIQDLDGVKLADMDANHEEVMKQMQEINTKVESIERNTLTLIDMGEVHRIELGRTREVAAAHQHDPYYSMYCALLVCATLACAHTRTHCILP